MITQSLTLCPVCRSNSVLKKRDSEIESGKEISFSYTFSPSHNRALAVYGCLECSHVFCSPIPDDIGVNYKDVVDQEYLKHQLSRNITNNEVLRVLKTHKSGGKLLDIGCATGDFIEVAQKMGFQSEGVEPSVWSSTIARKRGLVIHQELLKDFADQHLDEYDIVTLWGVIEHFSDPAAEIQRIQKVLKPGGILAIWTGDASSITALVLGRKWWYWQGQHIQYFTHRSLKKLVSNAGFDHLETHTYPFAASYETISNSLRRYKAHKFLTALAKPLFMFKRNYILKLPGEMFFIAQKNA